MKVRWVHVESAMSAAPAIGRLVFPPVPAGKASALGLMAAVDPYALAAIEDRRRAEVAAAERDLSARAGEATAPCAPRWVRPRKKA